MRKFLAPLVACLALVGAASWAGVAQAQNVSYGAPPELADRTYPEKRVYTETQEWWDEGRVHLAAPPLDFAFSSSHVHMGMNFPLGERLVLPPDGQGYVWEYLRQDHNGVGATTRGDRGGGFQMGCGGLTYAAGSRGRAITMHDQRFVGKLLFDDCDMDVWRSKAGTFENRFTADTTSKHGKRMYQSGAWLAQINVPGAPVTVTARGWYETTGYTNITLKTKVQAHTLASGAVLKPGSTVNYALAQGARWAFAYIDANIHAGTKGRVIFENRTGSTGSFVMPADLAPGDHVLLLGGIEKRDLNGDKVAQAGDGWNGGVLRLPFRVS